mmetsp:Transcript_27610/g.89952  ORF Transcript_27610/g.89952 Transcript_27610/m.89952 type:complete len:90 (+) Transcript_27610:2702-2971(+)
MIAHVMITVGEQGVIQNNILSNTSTSRGCCLCMNENCKLAQMPRDPEAMSMLYMRVMLNVVTKNKWIDDMNNVTAIAAIVTQTAMNVGS